jgi:hypothetical protein
MLEEIRIPFAPIAWALSAFLVKVQLYDKVVFTTI